jgi:hypothetical protein
MGYLKLAVCWLAFQRAFCHMKLYSMIQSALLILYIWFCKSVKWTTCSWLVSDQRAWSQLAGLHVAYMWCRVIPGHCFIKGQQVKKEMTHCLTLSLYICISSLWLIQSIDGIWWNLSVFLHFFTVLHWSSFMYELFITSTDRTTNVFPG